MFQKNENLKEKFDRYSLRRCAPEHGDAVDVLGWSTYPKGSVLEGQPMKVFLDSFDDEVAARAAYPKATQWSNKLTDPPLSFSHLPDENDPVPGGMYPDDWTDEPLSGSKRYAP